MKKYKYQVGDQVLFLDEYKNVRAGYISKREKKTETLWSFYDISQTETMEYTIEIYGFGTTIKRESEILFKFGKVKK
jgi:hypothetical protein